MEKARAGIGTGDETIISLFRRVPTVNEAFLIHISGILTREPGQNKFQNHTDILGRFLFSSGPATLQKT